MITLKSLPRESVSNIIVSMVKKNVVEDPMRRAQTQYAFGELGIGPKVLLTTRNGSYYAEKSPYPVLSDLAKTGKVDIMDIMRNRIGPVLSDHGIYSYDDQPDNIAYDISSGKFHIIDAGGASVSGKVKGISKGLSGVPETKKPAFNAAIKNRTKIGEGESRIVFEISRNILNYFSDL